MVRGADGGLVTAAWMWLPVVSWACSQWPPRLVAISLSGCWLSEKQTTSLTETSQLLEPKQGRSGWCLPALLLGHSFCCCRRQGQENIWFVQLDPQNFFSSWCILAATCLQTGSVSVHIFDICRSVFVLKGLFGAVLFLAGLGQWSLRGCHSQTHSHWQVVPV